MPSQINVWCTGRRRTGITAFYIHNLPAMPCRLNLRYLRDPEQKPNPRSTSSRLGLRTT